MILCGWCGKPTEPGRCRSCQRDAVLPWAQRGVEPPTVASDDGRPALDEAEVRARYDEARAGLVAEGKTPTVEALAERLDRSPRTVREWRRRYGLR